MNNNDEYLNIPKEESDNTGEEEKFVYDNAATPYRTTQIYKISYDTNLSKDINKSS